MCTTRRGGKMKDYTIKQTADTMIIIDRETGQEQAEYQLTAGRERAEIAQMRRALDRHLSLPGSTLGNYQW
jgi:hypothetical protein